jgi:formate dehydrogenase major subunit
MLLRKTRKANTLPQPVALYCEPHRLDRRAFLRHSGLSAGGLALLASSSSVRRAAGEPSAAPAPGTVTRKNVCTHCSVGCTVMAEVQNGIRVRQQPAWESPINRGTHCAKAAVIREIVQSDRRLKYPLKLAGGQRTRISWDQAIAQTNSYNDLRDAKTMIIMGGNPAEAHRGIM